MFADGFSKILESSNLRFDSLCSFVDGKSARQLTIVKHGRNISRVIMNSRRYFSYYWFGYFTSGKASLLAHEFKMTSR